MAKLPRRREETLGGQIVHGLPFPVETSPEALAFLKHMAPLQVEQEYSIKYLHSYGQDSPWFAGVTNGRLLGTRDPETGYTYATPRGAEPAGNTPCSPHLFPRGCPGRLPLSSPKPRTLLWTRPPGRPKGPDAGSPRRLPPRQPWALSAAPAA